MDTTYFGRSFGIMVLYDSISKKPLYVEEVKYETNMLYQQAICSLQQKGLKIQSIVCDGRKGLVNCLMIFLSSCANSIKSKPSTPT